MDRSLLESLPRGGVTVKTSKGLIQLGVPMWTNKDAFLKYISQKGFSKPKEEIPHLIPTVFLLDPQYGPETTGLLSADFLQYMFFVTQETQFTLVAPDGATQERLGKFLDLSFQGPRDASLTEKVRSEYLFGTYGIPDLGREISEGFPAPPPEVLRKVSSLNSSGQFTHEGVTIKKLGPLVYVISDQGESLGRVDLRDFPIPQPDFRRDLEAAKDPSVQAIREKLLIEGRPGLLAIGTGHGFTPGEETSGFMIWNGGRAVLVDPPSSTLEFLYAYGIPLEAIDGIILTHGHTDHHGNAIPKLLRELPKVKVYSTPAIFEMLQKQYELALGSEGEGLQQWNFVPMYPQQFSQIIGLHFRPDYSFHSVPAIGFEIYDRPDVKTGKLVTLFTGDTFADFADVWKHVQPGPGGKAPLMDHERALSVMRHMALLFKTSQQNPPPVMLIEGGIAPIHIDPKKTRKLLDFAERYGVDTSRVRIYHIGEQPALDAGVTKWKPGPQGFLDLSSYYPFEPAGLEPFVLRVMEGLPLFNSLQAEVKQSLLRNGTLKRLNAGETLIQEGAQENGVYLMVDGEVEVLRSGQLITVRPSGLLGEGALYGEPRNATVKTTVPSVFLQMDATTLQRLVKETDLIETLRNIRELRKEAYAAVVQSPLRRLPDSTLDILFSIGKVRDYSPGEFLIQQGDASRDVYIIIDGKTFIFNREGSIDTVGSVGTMIGEMALIGNAPRMATVMAQGSVKALELPSAKLKDLMEQYPGIRIALRRTAESRNGDRPKI
jgi:CRP-like cAMP-binding protein